MKQLSLSTKLYLYTTYVVGIAVFIWQMSNLDLSNGWMLLFLCVLASLTLILKVEGPTNRSHYTFSFLIYGFTFALFGTPEALLVIVVSNLAEWAWNRPPWYIQLFNSSCYVLVMQAAGLVYFWINPENSFVSWQAVLAIIVSMASFNFLNHLMVGIIVWLARGENFRSSGVFDFFPFVLDLTLLYFGASLSFVWMYNSFALVLFLIPIYLIYNTLRVPALERKTEIDPKTSLFNHEYFMQQVSNELTRANRFDRPLTIIMADLDLLRNINNTYGHLAGDEVLIGIAKILKQSVREYDIAARFGGEEFAILLPETTILQAYDRAETIRKAIEEMEFTVPTNISPIRATMSFGIACRENFGQTTEEIIHNADTALYHSKLSGRNRVYAYTNDKYVNFPRSQDEDRISKNSTSDQDFASSEPAAESVYRLPQRDSSRMDVEEDKESENEYGSDELDKQPNSPGSKFLVNFYISMITLIALVSLVGISQLVVPDQQFAFSSDWASLLIISVLIAASEWFSVSLYFKQTAVSTSAIPILVGYLLFGPVGIAVVSLVVSFSMFVKYRSPLNRFFFNFGNHLLAGTACFVVILISGKTFVQWDSVSQIVLSLISALAMYIITTWSIALGMSLDLKQSAHQIWKEQYAWLAPYYIGFGLITYTLIFGYKYDHNMGMILMSVPMVLLRLSQNQYVNRTREAVIELREKNQSLKRKSEEMLELTEGLLETLSEVSDLRERQAAGHSRQVAYYATEIAKRMKLTDKQVELIHKGALIHDIGKLGTPEYMLAKPSRLTAEEYEVVKRHAALGGEIVGRSPSLRALAPIVRHHHECFNGSGYPDRLRGNQICIEARIVAIADAIASMSSDQPYRKALGPLNVIDEVRDHAGTQFDPLIAAIAIEMLEMEAAAKRTPAEPQSDLLRRFSASTPPS